MVWLYCSVSSAGVAQLVERNLAKVEVAGSSPVARLFFFPLKFICSCLRPAERSTVVDW